MHPRRTVFGLAVTALALTATATTAQAQAKGHYAVSSDKAMTATRAVLERKGYELVRVIDSGDAQVIYYRRGNHGRGQGGGPMERMVIRTVERRVVFEEVPSGLLLDIDLELKL